MSIAMPPYPHHRDASALLHAARLLAPASLHGKLVGGELDAVASGSLSRVSSPKTFAASSAAAEAAAAAAPPDVDTWLGSGLGLGLGLALGLG